MQSCCSQNLWSVLMPVLFLSAGSAALSGGRGRGDPGSVIQQKSHLSALRGLSVQQRLYLLQRERE